MTNETDELQRVIFELPPSDWHAYGTEGIWARRITYDTYRLDNIPFFVDDVSVNDVVRVIPSDEQLLVAEVVARGGHSTCRIALQADWELSLIHI